MKTRIAILLVFGALACRAWGSAAGQDLYFPPASDDWAGVTPQSLGWDVPALDAVFKFVESSHDKSFLILKDGKIVAERYWTPAGSAHAQYIMSSGKSITAFLVGIAQEQGKLKVDQPVSDFLGGGWTSTSRFVMNARDMGRFGLMILAGGKWNGQPIMKDEAYFRAMLSTSQDLNLSYGYLWWLNGKDSHLTVRAARSTTAIKGPVTPHAPKDLLEANGRGGQHIYAAPSLNLVVVRLGDSPGVFGWDSQLWEKLNLAMRTTSEADGTVRTGRPKTTAPKSRGSDIR